MKTLSFVMKSLKRSSCKPQKKPKGKHFTVAAASKPAPDLPEQRSSRGSSHEALWDDAVSPSTKAMQTAPTV